MIINSSTILVSTFSYFDELVDENVFLWASYEPDAKNDEILIDLIEIYTELPEEDFIQAGTIFVSVEDLPDDLSDGLTWNTFHEIAIKIYDELKKKRGL